MVVFDHSDSRHVDVLRFDIRGAPPVGSGLFLAAPIWATDAFFIPSLQQPPPCVEAITFHRKDGTNSTLGHSSRAEEGFVLHDGEQIVRVDGGTGIQY